MCGNLKCFPVFSFLYFFNMEKKYKDKECKNTRNKLSLIFIFLLFIYLLSFSRVFLLLLLLSIWYCCPLARQFSLDITMLDCLRHSSKFYLNDINNELEKQKKTKISWSISLKHSLYTKFRYLFCCCLFTYHAFT